jgi:hypothetical protein
LPGLVLLGLAAACGERSSQDKPAPASTDWTSWTVADTGFGPITIGMTPEQANAAVGGALQLPQSTTMDGCDYATHRGVDSLLFMVEQGKIVRVEVRRHDIQTAAGARIGDSEARIEQLYPGRVRVSPHKYTAGHYLTVVPADTGAHRYRLIFETDGAVVTKFRGGAVPQVEYVEGCS